VSDASCAQARHAPVVFPNGPVSIEIPIQSRDHMLDDASGLASSITPVRRAKGVEPSWDALVLVCKTCRKRRNGPRDVKAKGLALDIRKSAKSQGLKPRVLLTSCQGLCPKEATSVTTVRRDGGTELFAVQVSASQPIPRLF
jgi:hypothetical protein